MVVGGELRSQGDRVDKRLVRVFELSRAFAVIPSPNSELGKQRWIERYLPADDIKERVLGDDEVDSRESRFPIREAPAVSIEASDAATEFDRTSGAQVDETPLAPTLVVRASSGPPPAMWF